MVNVIDNGARNRANLMPVGIKIVDDKGNVAHAAKTDLGTNYISLQSEWFGSSSNNNGGSTGGNAGGNTDHPTVGADYYPGSVYDGTVSGRTLLYSGVTSTTDKTNVVLPESVGKELNLLGDGTQYQISIIKTPITRGVKENTSVLSVVYDIQDKKVSGKFVTTSPVPVSNKKEDLLTGDELVNPLNGIGEGEQTTEVKAPELHVQYDSKTNSIDVWGVQGYALDNLSDTKTGSLYDVQVTLINSFYVQNAVAQLPTDIDLFNGDTSDELELSGTNTFFDNIGEMLEINVENYAYFKDSSLINAPEETRIALATLGMKNKFNISKEDLINGNTVSIDTSGVKDSYDTLSAETLYTGDSNNPWKAKQWQYSSKMKVLNSAIEINNGKININFKLDWTWTAVNKSPIYTGYLKVTSVKTAKAGE